MTSPSPRAPKDATSPTYPCTEAAEHVVEEVSLERRFCDAYWQALNDLEAIRLRQWEESRLTFAQLRVLFLLRRHPGMTTGCLARRLGVTVSTTSGLVAKLVERGLVSRGCNDEDRRQIPLALTEKGRQSAGELARVPKLFIEGVAAELADDIETVVAALETLTAASERVWQHMRDMEERP
jgi:DNA-binding MarR family transcriptional regulator